MYESSVHGTIAATAPPKIEERDPSFACKDFGSGLVGVIACRKKSAP